MNSFRIIPKIDELLNDKDIVIAKENYSKKVVTNILRLETEYLRTLIKNNEIQINTKQSAIDFLKTAVFARLQEQKNNRLKPVINATGIIVHTNLGRSPLSKFAIDRINEVGSDYNNLEYNIDTGIRGSRLSYIENILKELTGAESAVVVNNNAAAIYIVLNSLCKNKEVIISRGELVEIGGSFRVSNIIEESGCILKEVGTTNKTKISDYKNNITENTSAFLKVHKSNFKIIGFTAEVSSEEMVKIKNDNIIVIEDVGSGILIDLSKYGIKGEKTVKKVIQDGVDIVTFSGDKVLGGPQAGIIVGKKEYISKIKENQMYRTMRLDKLCLIALEATLIQYIKGEYMDIPVIRNMITPKENILEKAEKLYSLLKNNEKILCYIDENEAMFGGGALPDEFIKSYAVFIKPLYISVASLEIYLRNLQIPVICVTKNDHIVLDLRTVEEKYFDYLQKSFLEI
ncbi:MAG: L-seryl-tRNA(Sec) selenium transferase [Defluviitaleaceae bacterium]|nr:L-seryl-tRNA(Sec) selenium transferase [Defluviitaleaceae bacterium]